MRRVPPIIVSVAVSAVIILVAVTAGPLDPESTPRDLSGELTGVETDMTYWDAVHTDPDALNDLTLPASGCDPDGALPDLATPRNETVQEPEFRGRPAYTARINRFGLREDDFSLRPPENTTRIFLVGDSHTWAEGVNRSDRYSDILEDRLNAELNGTYQVINSGQPGFGMKDYCLMVEHLGFDTEPDMILVAWTFYDAIPREMADRMTVELRENTSLEGDEVYDVLQTMKSDLYRNMVLDADAPVPAYMARMHEMGAERDIPVVFFPYRPLFEHDAHRNEDVDSRQFFDRFLSERGYRHVGPVPEFVGVDLPSSGYMFPDGHYNARANRLIADHLADELPGHLPDTEQDGR